MAPEDSQVDVGRPEKVAAGSTMAVVYVAMTLVAETGARLVAKGHRRPRSSPRTCPGLAPGHNPRVFEAYARRLAERGAP